MFVNMPDAELYYIVHSYDATPMEREFLLHAHSHYEILVFISGDITYLVEGNEYHPQPYDILIFDVAETHRVVVNSNVPYERLVIQMDKKLFSDMAISRDIFMPFTNRTLGENNILHLDDFEDGLCKNCIHRLENVKLADRVDVISLLLTFLNEIRRTFVHEELCRSRVPLLTQIMVYVNDHITEDISSEIIAEHFYISRTAVYTMFKNATGTGIHNYVNVKRLIMAQDMLSQGIKPTNVFEKCGFRDYTSFFRAYKKLFNKSPSDDAAKRLTKR